MKLLRWGGPNAQSALRDSRPTPLVGIARHDSDPRLVRADPAVAAYWLKDPATRCLILARLPFERRVIGDAISLYATHLSLFRIGYLKWGVTS